MAFPENWTVHCISFEMELHLSEVSKHKSWSIGFPETMVGMGCLTMSSLWPLCNAKTYMQCLPFWGKKGLLDAR